MIEDREKEKMEQSRHLENIENSMMIPIGNDPIINKIEE